MVILIITDESETQASSETPIPATQRFLGSFQTVVRLASELRGMSDVKLLIVTKSYGLVSEDTRLPKYKFSASSQGDAASVRTKIAEHIGNLTASDVVVSALSLEYIAYAFGDDLKPLKGSKAKLIFIASKKLKALLERNGVNAELYPRVGVARVTYQSKQLVMESLRHFIQGRET